MLKHNFPKKKKLFVLKSASTVDFVSKFHHVNYITKDLIFADFVAKGTSSAIMRNEVKKCVV
jgi:hypothetical protein